MHIFRFTNEIRGPARGFGGVGWQGLAWIWAISGPPGGRILPNQTQFYGKLSTAVRISFLRLIFYFLKCL